MADLVVKVYNEVKKKYMVAVFDLWKDSVATLHSFITSVRVLSALLRWQQIMKIS